MSDENTKTRVPYLSYTTFNNFLNGMRKAGVVPTRVDKTAMPGQSGQVQSYLLSAMRFFKFINDLGVPQGSLHALIEGQEDQQQAVWHTVFVEAYAPILGNLDLSRASVGELHDRFKALDLNGETIRKAHSFYAAAADSAGVVLGPHLKMTTRPSSSPRRAKKTRVVQPAPEPPPPPAPVSVKRTMDEMLLEKFPAFDPAWPDELKAQWFSGFGTLMGKAKASE